jgi:hypothetical protein
MRRLRLALFVAAAITGPAAAQDAPAIVPAEPGSWQATVGNVILHYVGGRSLADVGGPGFNPFQIDGEGLLFSLGSFFVTSEFQGQSVHEGEVSILPQFTTPLEAFEPSEATPAIISFALVKSGVCIAGYVAGHPIPNATYAVDLGNQICHAAIVEEIVYAQYAAANPVAPKPEPQTTVTTFDAANPLDLDLDVAVWAAYNAAYNLAVSDADYLFIRNGDFGLVRDAILKELQSENLPGIEVVEAPTATEAFGCAPPGKTLIRVAFVANDEGIILAAASSRRVSTYVYDPTFSSDLDIGYARDCQTEGFGRVHAVNVP